MSYKALAVGLATYVPGINKVIARGRGSSDSARYCYSVWLRHLVKAGENNLNTSPSVVAELGPGGSIGMGIAALLSGARQYYAFDIVAHSDLSQSIQILNELVELFRTRSKIPDQKEFPQIKPQLESYEFPSHILTDETLEKSLASSNTDKIRKSLSFPESNESVITYKAPWYSSKILNEDSVDMIFSQAVLEHVDSLEDTYLAMGRWLKKSGFISHQIDFRSHGTTEKWNGHWLLSDFKWRLIKGNRSYLLNRQPHSVHIKLLEKAGFSILCDEKVSLYSDIHRKDLAERFKSINDEDLTTSGAFIQAIRK